MDKCFKLRNGISMPIVGFGTFKLNGDICKSAVSTAITKHHYQLIDSAHIYRNGMEIGETLNSIGVLKEDSKNKNLFITSKISTSYMGFEKVLICYDKIMKDLKYVNKLDLLLLHWPGASNISPEDNQNRKLRISSWKALEQLYNNGKVNSIGVSNYLVNHLDELKMDGATIMPMVNQLELHPYCFYDDLDIWARKNDMKLQAYSSLGSGGDVLKDSLVKKIAESHGKSSAQILLKWGLQRGYMIIPRSSSDTHIQQNTNLFDFTLSDDDMKELNSLHCNKHYCWNPEIVA